jgi:hypothetical protein
MGDAGEGGGKEGGAGGIEVIETRSSSLLGVTSTFVDFTISIQWMAIRKPTLSTTPYTNTNRFCAAQYSHLCGEEQTTSRVCSSDMPEVLDALRALDPPNTRLGGPATIPGITSAPDVRLRGLGAAGLRRCIQRIVRAQGRLVRRSCADVQQGVFNIGCSHHLEACGGGARSGRQGGFFSARTPPRTQTKTKKQRRTLRATSD